MRNRTALPACGGVLPLHYRLDLHSNRRAFRLTLQVRILPAELYSQPSTGPRCPLEDATRLSREEFRKCKEAVLVQKTASVVLPVGRIAPEPSKTFLNSLQP